MTWWSSFIDCRLFQELSINGFLCLSDTNIDMHLNLGQKVLFYFSLNSSKHKRSKNFVQLLNHLIIFLFFFFVCQVSISFASEIKPFVKIFRWTKNVRKKEVQETPKLMDVVLKRSTSQQESIFWIKLSNSLWCLTIFIFNFMSFINYNIFPIELHQWSHTNSDSFKSSNTYIELPGL